MSIKVRFLNFLNIDDEIFNRFNNFTKVFFDLLNSSAFLTDDHGTSESVRLNFSTPTDEQIVDGISRLGDLTKKMF